MRIDALEYRVIDALDDRLGSMGWERLGGVDFEDKVSTYSRMAACSISHRIIVSWSEIIAGFSYSPVMSVRHSVVNLLAARFAGQVDSEETSTFGRSLISLLPSGLPADRVTTWWVRSEEDVDPVVEKISADVERYGLPFLQRYRDLDDIISHLEGEQRHQVLSGYLAIACGLAERQTQAERALAEYAEASHDQRGPMLRQSQDFLREFTVHFGFGFEFLPGN